MCWRAYVCTDENQAKQVRYKGFAISVFRSENVKDAVARAKYIVARLIGESTLTNDEM